MDIKNRAIIISQHQFREKIMKCDRLHYHLHIIYYNLSRIFRSSANKHTHPVRN